MLFRIFFSFLLLISGSEAFNGETDARIRRCLLEVLRRFHLRLGPLDIPAPTLRRTREVSLLESLPFDMKYHALMPFVDSTSLRELSCVNRNFHDVTEVTVYRHLCEFDPYFVTEDHLVNILLHVVLLDHFPRSTYRSSPRFQDELELLTLKFNFDFEAINSDIPRNIIYYLLCFLHEITYGLDSLVPTSKEFGRVHFIRQLRQKYLPMSEAFFIEAVERDGFQPESSDNTETFPWRSNVLFFSSMRPDADAVKLHFQIVQVVYNNIIALPIANEFRVAIFELLIPEFPIHNLGDVSEFLSKHCSFYKTIAREPSCWNFQDFRCFKEKYSRMAQNYPNSSISSWFLQIYTADSINQFSLEAFEALGKNLLASELRNVSRTQTLSLATLEMFSQMINSKVLLNSFDLNKVLSDVFSHENILMFEVLVKESIRPLCTFYKFNGQELHIMFLNSAMAPSATFLKLFVESYTLKDPWIFFLMNWPLLKALKPFIQDKFDLNRRYRHEFTTREIREIPLFGSALNSLRGDEFTFKQVVNSLNSDELKEVFSSDISVFDSGIEVDSLSLTIISPTTAIFNKN